jgi:hypothetical protein
MGGGDKDDSLPYALCICIKAVSIKTIRFFSFLMPCDYKQVFDLS